MGGTGDGRGAVTAARLLCGSCGTELPPDSRFCNKNGVTRCPHYRRELAVIAVFIPAKNAHVHTQQVIT